MEKVGRKILKRCAGLPLAIIVLGGLLATKQSLNEWNKVHENVKLYLRRGKGQDQEYSDLHGVLALSYHELPYHLKPCFLHLGHFPEDYDIPSKTLFRLWVAEGLVPQIQSEVDGTETMEDLAEYYLGELIDRSMVQVGQMGSTGRVKTCRLHDLMRDLCLSKANEEKFLEIVRAQNINEKLIPVGAHRFAVYADDKDLDLKYYARTTYLRSLLFFGTQFRTLSTFRYFKLLKILSLDGCRIGKKMAEEIGCLIHLRYLAFENCIIDHLPSSIGDLRYLQTFIMEEVFLTNTATVPNVLWKLEQLRHLKLGVTHMNKLLKLGNMRKLQTLSGINTLSGFDTYAFDVAELENFYTLKKLKISLRESEDMEVIPSVCLNRLTSLCVRISYCVKEEKLKSIFPCCHRLQKLHFRGRIDKLPEYQHFPPNLTKLTLRDSNFKEDPMAMLEKLPNLVILCLLSESFIGKLLVCSSKGFPRLKTLVFEFLYYLEEWRVDEEAMPSLCQLRIWYCRKLKMIPDGIKFITTLRQLEIIYMPTAFAERLRVVKGREGDDLYKVRHVPSIIFQHIS